MLRHLLPLSLWRIIHIACMSTLTISTRRLQKNKCHHEVWMHLSHVNDRAEERPPRYNQSQRLHLKEILRNHLGSRHGTRRLVLPHDMFDFPMDAAPLVIILHGELLRTCSSVVQEHFQGLAQAGRYLRSAGLISPKDARKLRMIDDCCALVRHITTVSSAQAVKYFKDKISCAMLAPERHHRAQYVDLSPKHDKHKRVTPDEQ